MSDYHRPAAGNKTHPCKSETLYRAWSASKLWCAACGADWFPLETHHMVKAGRSHESCNLLRLCHRDHTLAEGLDVRDERTGRLLPKLPLAVCLSLKLRADPGELSTAADWSRLEELRGSRLPAPAAIPPFFLDLWRANRPECGG